MRVIVLAKTGGFCLAAAVILVLVHRLGLPMTGVAFAISIAIDPKL